jgi:hypothetical protein
MKTLISNNGGYKLYAEIVKPVRDVGQVQLRFTSQWNTAKNPDEFQTRFETMLTVKELSVLKSML